MAHENPDKAFPDVRTLSLFVGKGEIKMLTGIELSQAIEQLPIDVQRFLKRKPEHVQAILNGQTVPDSSSNAAGSVDMLVTNKGIEVLHCVRDC